LEGKRDKGRILAVDYGSRRIGLAISDPLRITSQVLGTLEVDSADEAVRAISEVILKEDVSEVVVGMPLKMDGGRGRQAEEVEKFVELLERSSGVGVVTWDERLTSVAATRALNDMGLKLKGRKNRVDSIAACLILQSYLESLNGGRS